MADYNLTTGNDTFVAPASGSTVYATAATLNAGDSLTGGAGTDVLVLSGSGTFRVDQLANFTGFENIRLDNATNSFANLTLGSQAIEVDATGPLSIQAFSPLNWNGSDIVNGDTSQAWPTILDFLNNQASYPPAPVTYDLTSNTFSHVSSINAGPDNITLLINSADAAGVQDFSASGMNDKLVTTGSTLDLSHTTVSGFTVASTNGVGTTFTVGDLGTAFQIVGGPGHDTLIAQGLTLTADQRTAIFETSSIETITDQSGTYVSPRQVAPTLSVSSDPSGPAFPLTMGPNNRYFVDQNGVPFLVNGDSPQALLVNLSSSDMDLYMANRKSHGFNTIIVDVLADTYTGGNTNGTTYDGIAPFTSGSSPSNYDLSTPNPTYFARLDALVSMATANGFLLFLDPIETGGWLQTLQNNGTSKAFDFGVFLGNRYKNSPNVAWQSGNDFQSWTNTSDSNLVYQVMAGIKSVAPSQIQTIELSFLTSYSNQDTVTLPAINMDAAYTYHETYDLMLQGFNSSPTSPVFLVEGHYEGENLGFSFPDVTGTFILRAQEYWTMTSGGVGQFYGSRSVWNFASDWQSTLDSAGVAQLPYWTALFTSVGWWKLVPDQNHQIVTAGYGTYNANNDNFYSSNYATTAWNPDGTTSVTYDIAGSALTVNLAKFAGPVSAQWYDPSNGTYQSVTGSPFTNTSSRVFQPPGKNQEGYNDWVLVLRASAVADTQPPTSLVVNGGFETSDFTGWPGWTLSGNVAPLSYGPQTFLINTAQSGQSAAGLGPVGSDGTLSQDIQTTAGQHYTLSFWLANASGGPNDFTATWNGQALLALVDESAQGYTEYTFDVVGTAPTSHLEFDFRQDPSYWSLDSISVTAVGSQAPAAPVISTFFPDSDNANVLTLSGMAAAGSTVKVYDRTTPLGTTTANSSGAWSSTTGTLSNTTHSFTVTATDAAGNTSATSAPLVVTWAPSGGQNLVVNGSFETGAFTGWTLSGNVAPLNYGPQTFVLNTAQSGQSAAGLGPVGSDGTLSQDIQTTAGQHYTLSFWLANASGGPNDFTATWNGQTLLALVDESAQGYTEYTFDVVGTAPTSHLEFDFRQDPSYWSLDSISVTAVGSQAPAAPVISTFFPDSDNANVLTLSGMAAAGSTVKVYDRTTPLGTTTANSSGAWSSTTGTLSNTTHSFTVTATDAAGNTSATSAPLVVTWAPSGGQNLVVNGSFETGAFTGWTLSGNVAPLSYGPQTFLINTAQSGQSAAGLGPVGSDGTLSQDIQTTAGQHYTLSFWLANASGGPNDFTATWNGQALLALVDESAQGYTEYTFDVVGTAPTSHLEFDFRQDPSYWSLDSISVTPVATATIAAGATLELASASSTAVTFTGSIGTLKLDNSASFTGTVAGLTGQDTIDFADISSSSVQQPSFSGTASGGTLTVTDGTHTASIALLGNYLASTFVPSSDGHGGTSVVDPSIQPPLLAQPHHA